MNIFTLAVGVVAGAVLSRWWRPILRETVRAGMNAETKVNEVLHVVREELQDVVAEVTEKSDEAGEPKPQQPV